MKTNINVPKNLKKQKKATNYGFTLIELLAVIIILAVLMIIAIPSVSTYINDSRKKAYITSAKEHIDGAMYLVNTGKLKTYDAETTYYIPGHCVEMENESSSPYGEWKDRYIGVIYDGKGFKYYWTSTDKAQVGIKLTAADELDVDLLETGISSVFPNEPIENRTKILVLSDNCLPGEWVDATNPDNPGGGSGETTNPGGSTSGNGTVNKGNNTWEKDVLRIQIQQGYCWEQGNDKICNISFNFTNTGSTTITKWSASFTLPAGASLYSNSIGDFAHLSIIGNKIKLSSTDAFWNFLQPGDSISKPDAIQIKIPKNLDFNLEDGLLDYEFITDESQSGTTNGGVIGNASDMHKDLAEIKVELKRVSYWGSGTNYFAIYDIIVTNTSSNDINTWSFTLDLPEQITKLTPWGITATKNGSSYLIKPNGSNERIAAGSSVTISSAFQFDMTDVNAIPDIK